MLLNNQRGITEEIKEKMKKKKKLDTNENESIMI